MPPVTTAHVSLATQGEVAILRFCRETSNNALNESMLEQLHDCWGRVLNDASIRTVVFSGGAGMFMAGADLPFFVRSLMAGDIDRILAFTRSAHALLERIEQCDKCTIAWVGGPAMGGGLELALACDRIVACQGAKFAFPETGLGIYPGMGGTQRTPRRLGIGLAKWMIYTGATVPATQALELGLIDAVSDADSLPEMLTSLDSRQAETSQRPTRWQATEQLFADESVAELLDTSRALPANPHLTRAVIQTRSKAPIALALAERIIDDGMRTSLEEGVRIEFSHLAEIFATQDARTGLLSLGKGRPQFVGR